MGGGIPIDWNRVATVLPDGFDPIGFPGDPWFDEPRGAPEGTYASLYGILLAYEEAWLDDEPLAGGHLALALTIVEPSSDNDVGTLRHWMILAAAASDARLAESLIRWGFDAVVGDIEMAFEPAGSGMEVVRSHGRVTSDLVSFSVDVHGQGLAGQRIGYGQEIGTWGVRDREAGPALIYHLPAHNQLPGPATLDGRFGALGDVEASTATGTAATWFGSAGGSPDENEAGQLRYTFAQ